jgi:hypothetical protein
MDSGILRAKDRLDSPSQTICNPGTTASQQYHCICLVALLPRGSQGLWYFRISRGYFLIAGKNRIMNKHRMTAMMTVVVFTGFMQALAAQDNTDIAPADNTPPQNTTETKPLTETPVVAAPTPAQALAQSNDKLLNEMKVYPSF